MHPDRRRAGRAIRKQRQINQAQVDQNLRVVAEVGARAGAAMAVFATTMAEAAEALGRSAGTAYRSIAAALAPRDTAVPLAEVGAGHPSQSGVARVSEAPVASEGVEQK